MEQVSEPASGRGAERSPRADNEAGSGGTNGTATERRGRPRAPRPRPVGVAAVVHDFFIQDGGAERIAIELARLLPTASVHTTFFDEVRFADRLDPARVRTWPLQRVLGATPRFRALLPLYPVWFSVLDLRGSTLVVSSSSHFAKAVRTSRSGVHVAYVHTPARYIWQLDAYLAGSSYALPARLAGRLIRPFLQAWDRRTAAGPDVIACNSHAIRERIRHFWGRDAVVIPPAVDTREIPFPGTDEGFLLVAARLLAYRRIDLAVEAASRLGRELVVVGEGPERQRLEAMAGSTVRFLGHVDRARLVELFSRCHAYLLPGVEDFGIAPVEAMAAGKPVVAFRGGGALDTVIEDRTGVFFEPQTADALSDAILRLDELSFDPAAIRAHAETFDSTVFRHRFRELFARLGVDPHLYSSA